jgi:Putative rhamnosyl transferase
MLKHFLVIRLGLGVYYLPWYESRLSLFEAVTFASLRAQSSPHFTTLIVVDRNIPPPARRRLRDIVAAAANFHIVTLDVTELRHVRHGSWDFVWDRCQDYLLAEHLVADPFEYVITSILDDDDAWHRDTVALVNRLLTPELPRLIGAEPHSLANYRHTSGRVLTFPLGLKWFAENDVVQSFEREFLGTSVFLLARFSSGLSALSSRHPAWPAMAHVAVFETVRAEPRRPMWVYVRHGQAETEWRTPTVQHPESAPGVGVSGPPGEARSIAALYADFGIDFAKVAAWRAAHPAPPEGHAGFLAREQLDCCFRIAALNRQLDALARKQAEAGLNRADETLLLQQQRLRLDLVRRLFRQGSDLFAPAPTAAIGKAQA